MRQEDAKSSLAWQSAAGMALESKLNMLWIGDLRSAGAVEK